MSERIGQQNSPSAAERLRSNREAASKRRILPGRRFARLNPSEPVRRHGIYSRDGFATLQLLGRGYVAMSSIEVRSEHLDQIHVGTLRTVLSARRDRVLRYAIDLGHKALNVHRELSAPEIFILQGKVDALVASWDEKFQQLTFKNVFRDGRAAAEEATLQAQERLRALSRVLAHTLTINDEVNWDTLKDRSIYKKPESFPEPTPTYSPVDRPVFAPPTVGFLDLLLGRKKRLIEEAEHAHAERYREWDAEEEVRETEYEIALAQWQQREQEFWETHAQLHREFEAQQQQQNAVIDELADLVAHGDPAAVIEHAHLVLENSDYSGLFEKSYTVQYAKDQKLLKIEYRLPNQDQLPNVKSVKFNKASGEFIETPISDRETKANFETVAFQIALRTLHEVFEADTWGHVDQILFNGVVEFIDRRTGREAQACILSVLTDRKTFISIDLGRVEPKACFKTLKGVSAASLASLSAITPVIEMDRTDKRFVEAKEVADHLDDKQNLASMPWEDFEHLVRELFEKEFASRGGEVKITQASRDGGVDAIAFDPDPITGGKIVNQAKRYTRTVGVSAVRDLFGTVMNEGASKGILVTTADYGPDAHQFASGKPLTLLSGSHLLYMLERHGYKAKIDLREARDQLHLTGARPE
jgi:restriction system protein